MTPGLANPFYSAINLSTLPLPLRGDHSVAPRFSAPHLRAHGMDPSKPSTFALHPTLPCTAPPSPLMRFPMNYKFRACTSEFQLKQTYIMRHPEQVLHPLDKASEQMDAHTGQAFGV